MKPAIYFLSVVFAALSFTTVSTAQMGMGMHPPSIAGVFNPVVGAGATYDVTTKNGAKTTLDIAVVDKDSGGYWMEMTMQMPEKSNGSAAMNGPVYARELLVRQRDDVVIQRVIVQMPGRPPMDMSSMPHPVQSQESKADIRANAQDIGSESVTTPAGTFSCEHWRNTKDGEDYWISDKVTPWQLVKMSGNKDNVVLTKVITGAKTHITGAPMSVQEMMQQRMGKPNQ